MTATEKTHPYPLPRRWDTLMPPLFAVPLDRRHLLLVVDKDPDAPYHVVAHGYIDDELFTHALCDRAWELEGGVDPLGHNHRRGYVEGPDPAIGEIIRSLRICERLCTECGDRAVGALELDPVARPHPARAAQADARHGRWR